MNLRGTLADGATLLRTWSRAKGTLVVSLAMPLLMLVAFGYLFSPDEPERPLLLVEDRAGTNESARLLQLLEAEPSLLITRGAPPEGADPSAWLREQGATGLLRILPANNASGAPVLETLVDPTVPVHASAVRTAVDAARLRHAGGETVAVTELPARDPAPYSAFLLAGVLGLSAMLAGLSMGYHSISELRHAGLLERLAVSPLSKREWLIARMAATSLIGLVTGIVIYGVALIFFPAPPTGGPIALLLVMGGTLVFSGLGTLLGLAVKDPQTGSAVMNLTLLPMVVLSGAFFDVARLPMVLQWAAALSPLTHLNNGLRADLLLGDASTALLHAGALLLASLVIILVGGRLIRWTQE
ncbi:MAG TPA: ABC transporter permease [Candidatus Thermoplasmatota archaeon]|nr:ABC transporter permease [Candidatus Thermoplasmatota archaeon]